MTVSGEKEMRDLLRLRRALSRAEQSLAEVDRALLFPEGLCPNDLVIIERLARKGAKPVNGLGRQVGLTSGSMTTAVQRLRRRGLVETRRDLDDKRVVWVSVTPAGEELAGRCCRAHAEVLSRIFSKWSERERTILTSFLKRIRKDAELSVGQADEAAAESG
jgi:MarR family 2-MHQ and catechol resistance regulon transcriptional repressor